MFIRNPGSLPKAMNQSGEMTCPSVLIAASPMKPPMTEDGMKRRWKIGKKDRMAIPVARRTQMAQKDMMAVMRGFRIGFVRKQGRRRKNTVTGDAGLDNTTAAVRRDRKEIMHHRNHFLMIRISYHAIFGI